MSGLSRVISNAQNALSSARRIGMLDLMASMGFVMALGFIQNFVLARLLGPEGLGHVSVLNSAIGFANLLSAMGVTVAILRFASAEREDSAAWAIFRKGIVVALCSSVAVGLGLVLLTRSPLWVFDRVAGDWLPWLAMGLPAFVLFLSISKYLQARQRMRDKAFLEFLSRLVTVIFVVAGALWAGFPGVVFGGLAGVLVGATMAALHIARVRPRVRVPSPVSSGELVRFGAWSVFAGVMGQVMSAADVLCVSAITEDARLTGFYGLAVMLQRVVRVPGAEIR